MTLAALLHRPRYALTIHLDGIPDHLRHLPRRHYTRPAAERRRDQLQADPRNGGVRFDVTEVGT